MCEKKNIDIKIKTKLQSWSAGNIILYEIKGMVNCQNSRDKGPPECNSATG